MLACSAPLPPSLCIAVRMHQYVWKVIAKHQETDNTEMWSNITCIARKLIGHLNIFINIVMYTVNDVYTPTCKAHNGGWMLGVHVAIPFLANTLHCSDPGLTRLRSPTNRYTVAAIRQASGEMANHLSKVIQGANICWMQL